MGEQDAPSLAEPLPFRSFLPFFKRKTKKVTNHFKTRKQTLDFIFRRRTRPSGAILPSEKPAWIVHNASLPGQTTSTDRLGTTAKRQPGAGDAVSSKETLQEQERAKCNRETTRSVFFLSSLFLWIAFPVAVVCFRGKRSVFGSPANDNKYCGRGCKPSLIFYNFDRKCV